MLLKRLIWWKNLSTTVHIYFMRIPSATLSVFAKKWGITWDVTLIQSNFQNIFPQKLDLAQLKRYSYGLYLDNELVQTTKGTLHYQLIIKPKKFINLILFDCYEGSLVFKFKDYSITIIKLFKFPEYKLIYKYNEGDFVKIEYL
jgi:hypothetical protein